MYTGTLFELEFYENWKLSHNHLILRCLEWDLNERKYLRQSNTSNWNCNLICSITYKMILLLIHSSFLSYQYLRYTNLSTIYVCKNTWCNICSIENWCEWFLFDFFRSWSYSHSLRFLSEWTIWKKCVYTILHVIALRVKYLSNGLKLILSTCD